MKKLTAFALALVMALGLLSGCGSSNSDSNTPSGDDASDAAAKTKLVVATSPDFPPFESLEGGEVVGIEVDILKKVAEKMGMELDLQQMDFDSVIPGVQAGKFDVGMSGITVTEKRKANVDFSSVYFMAAQAIVVTADSGITGKADLEGKTVSVQTGTTAHDALQKMQEEGVDVEILPYEKITQCFDDVSLGRADAVYVDSVVAAYYLADDDSKFQSVWKSDEGEPMGVCIKKGNTDLLEQTENAINTLYYNGKISELAMKHFGTDVTEGVRNVNEEPTVDPSKVKTVKDGVLTIGFEAGYPPLEYTDDSGLVYQGFDVDMAEEIGKLFGLEVEFVNTSFDGVFAGLDKGQYDMIIAGVSITPERQEAYEMTEPYLSNQLVIVTKKDA